MTRRKTAPPVPPELDPDRDDFQGARALSRKQVVDMIRRKETLVEADLRGCDLAGVSFEGVDLSYAKFAESNLSKCNFNRADLTGASLFGANLKDATFEEANLEETDFDYANLDGVVLRGAKVRKTLFPYRRVSQEAVRESVRSGKKLVMEASAAEDDE
jgi:uncharacterized protein YjbI with pentapeptide repeats